MIVCGHSCQDVFASKRKDYKCTNHAFDWSCLSNTPNMLELCMFEPNTDKGSTHPLASYLGTRAEYKAADLHFVLAMLLCYATEN